MDKLQTIEKIKAMICDLIITFPGTIKIRRKDKNLSVELEYYCQCDFRDFYKEGIFSRYGMVDINLENPNYHEILKGLLKMKKFLKSKFKNGMDTSL